MNLSDDAIVQSCDVYFYDLAYRMGIDRMHEFMRQFGFPRKPASIAPASARA